MKLNFEQFQSRLKSSGPASVYVFNGTEGFYLTESVRQLKHACLGGEEQSPSLAELEGAVELAQVLEQLKTFPFLAPRRLVIFRAADDFIAQHYQALLAFAAHAPDFSTLALYAKLDGRLTATKKLRKAVCFVACDPPSENALPRWLMARAREVWGVKLQPRAAHLLTELVGCELSRQDAELAKLASLAGERKSIDAGMVERSVLAVQGVSLFGALDAAVDGPPKRALELFSQLVARGFKGSRGNSGKSDPMAILMPFFSMLARDVRLQLSIRQQLDAGERPSPEALGVKDFPFRKAMGRARKRPLRRLERDMEALLQTDAQLKSSRDPVLAVERLVLRLSQAP